MPARWLLPKLKLVELFQRRLMACLSEHLISGCGRLLYFHQLQRAAESVARRR